MQSFFLSLWLQSFAFIYSHSNHDWGWQLGGNFWLVSSILKSFIVAILLRKSLKQEEYEAFLKTK